MATTSDSSSTSEPETFTTLSAWGWNGNGQLGNGTTTHHSSTPVEVSDLVGVRDTAAGHSCSLALKDDGTVWAWGRNDAGQLGNGTTTDSSTPVEVKDLNDPSGYLSGVQAIAAHDNFYSLALKDDGTLWAWGLNRAGQLGDGTTTSSNTPVQVSNLDGVKDIAGGFLCSLALKDDGTVWAWGSNTRGQLGNGTTTNISTPVQVSEVGGVIAIAASGGHSLAIQ